VLQAADESLKRLGTDFIDIYYLHKETMRRRWRKPCARWAT
jgi:aryl-alcohol dehydrogenase-like predicted oxidoreductase